MKKVKPEPRVDMYCRHCGGREVTRDALAEWDISSQTWVLSAVLDTAYCENCGEQSTLGEAPLSALQ